MAGIPHVANKTFFRNYISYRNENKRQRQNREWNRESRKEGETDRDRDREYTGQHYT